jgi:hypothetical protein
VIAFTLPSLLVEGVEFVDGDAGAQDTDATVNAATSELWMGGQTARSRGEGSGAAGLCRQ